MNTLSGVKNMAKNLKTPSPWSKNFQKERIDCHEYKDELN
jgi:hypothetical protein